MFGSFHRGTNCFPPAILSNGNCAASIVKPTFSFLKQRVSGGRDEWGEMKDMHSTSVGKPMEINHLEDLRVDEKY
jgi:hypothetical protein